MILKAKGIKKFYSKDGHSIEVLKGVDLEVEKGDFISIQGPSGVGKSTLLHILGLLDTPSEGEIYFSGEPVPNSEELRARIRNERIGFVFQQHYLLPEFTALENVAIPALIGGEPEDKAYEIARKMLERLGLSERIHHKPGELSGGEQQRVALARALVKSPLLVIADEPTGNLDKVTSTSVVELMLEINREEGVAFIVATHDENLAKRALRRFKMLDGVLFNL